MKTRAAIFTKIGYDWIEHFMKIAQLFQAFFELRNDKVKIMKQEQNYWKLALERKIIN